MGVVVVNRQRFGPAFAFLLDTGGHMRAFLSILVLSISSIADAKLSFEEIDDNRQVSRMRGVSIATDDSTSCFPPKLKEFINELRTRFGSVEINSGYRSRTHNRQVGGARRSQHMSCNAVDFSIPGVPRAEVKLFLTANFRGRAGVGYYCNDRFHLDIGSVRQWGGCQPTRNEIALAQRRYPRSQLAQLRTQDTSRDNHNHPVTNRDDGFATYVQ